MIDRSRWREEILSRIIQENREFGLEVWDGWRDLICDLVDRIEVASKVRCTLFQVKEKFAGLSFYLADVAPSNAFVKYPIRITKVQELALDGVKLLCPSVGAPASFDSFHGPVEREITDPSSRPSPAPTHRQTANAFIQAPNCSIFR